MKFDKEKEILNQNYCKPYHIDELSDYITNVSINTLNNSSQHGTSETLEGYSDFTHLSTILEKDSTYFLMMEANSSFDDSKVGIWIDWNGNATFEQEEEILSMSGML